MNTANRSLPGGLVFALAAQSDSALQPVWNVVLVVFGKQNLAHPLFPIVSMILFYFALVNLFMVFDLFVWNFARRYKLQPHKRVTWRNVRCAMWFTVWNQVMFILPVSIVQWITQPDYYIPDQAPSFFELAWQLVLCFVMFDSQYFIWHITHHKIRVLYKWCHSVHHQFHSPFSWATQYMHPWELFCTGLYSTVAPWVLDAHPLTNLAFQTCNIVVSVEAHCGYDLPFMAQNLLPISGVFWGGAAKHDMHHMRPMTNFQPFFKYLDILFGTDCPTLTKGGVKTPALAEYDRLHRDKRNAHWF